MNKSDKLELLTKLRKIIHTRADRRPKWFKPQFGLCYNIEQLSCRLGHKYMELPTIVGEDAITSWPHYSGDLAFPVPAPTPGRPAYDHYFRQTDHYNRRKAYCRLRYDLLDHIIKHVENDRCV